MPPEKLCKGWICKGRTRVFCDAARKIVQMGSTPPSPFSVENWLKISDGNQDYGHARGRGGNLVSNETIGIFADVTGEDRAYHRTRGP
jgi:hypothetical protein